jgi:hypothetical protein
MSKYDLYKKYIHKKYIQGDDAALLGRREEYIEKLKELENIFPYVVTSRGTSYIEKFARENNLQKGVDYEKMMEISNNKILFKNQHDEMNFDKFQKKEEWIRTAISNAEELIDKSYSRTLFVKKNNLKASINIVPKQEKFSELLETVIDFYMLNQYDLPNSSDDFIKNLFVINKDKNYFTIFIKDKNEASQLILLIADVAEVIG